MQDQGARGPQVDARIAVADDSPVRTITIDRPESRNALSSAMQNHLCASLAEADKDPAITAVILTGTDPAFCAGNDFADRAQFADRYGN